VQAVCGKARFFACALRSPTPEHKTCRRVAENAENPNSGAQRHRVRRSEQSLFSVCSAPLRAKFLHAIQYQVSFINGRWRSAHRTSVSTKFKPATRCSGSCSAARLKCSLWLGDLSRLLVVSASPNAYSVCAESVQRRGPQPGRYEPTSLAWVGRSGLECAYATRRARCDETIRAAKQLPIRFACTP